MKMRYFLGIDTSNYTTSVALLDGEDNRSSKTSLPLPVQEGQLGLRQNDAIFLHMKQIPKALTAMFSEFPGKTRPDAVGVSAFPRRTEGSYMPCFLAGVTAAEAISASLSIDTYYFSHQEGHIAAVIYGASRQELLYHPFIALHFSGGTTECLHVNQLGHSPVFVDQILESTSDLNAGQLVDRVGKMLGLSFPAGKELERLAAHSQTNFSAKAVGTSQGISFSGIENQCRAMYEQGRPPEDVARYCIEYIAAAAERMIESAREKVGTLPVLCCGGVMSNQIIKRKLQDRYKAVFALPQYCTDNAAGIAMLTQLEAERKCSQQA